MFFLKPWFSENNFVLLPLKTMVSKKGFEENEVNCKP
jgi:hypothetical protein